MAFMQKKAIATGELIFKAQNVEVYNNVKVSHIEVITSTFIKFWCRCPNNLTLMTVGSICCIL
jgi:hypothetical protein